MKTYFAILKEEVLFTKIRKKLEEKEFKIIKYYPKMRMVKFTAATDAKVDDIPFFESVEEERLDFEI